MNNRNGRPGPTRNSHWQKRGSWRGNFRGRGQSHASSQRNYNQRIIPEVLHGHCPPSQKDIRVMLPPVHCPYNGWHLYMTEAYKEESEIVRIVKVMECYFNNNPSILQGIEDKSSFLLNIQKTVQDPQIKEKIPTLYDMLIHTPQKVINLFGLAAHQTVSNKLETSRREEMKLLCDSSGSPGSCDKENLVDQMILPPTTLALLHARLTHLEKCLPLQHLKANYFGKFVSLKGTVVRVSSIKPYCKQMGFTCCTCCASFGLKQVDGKYTTPTTCPREDCKARLFLPDKANTKFTQTVDSQKIRLQEIILDDQREGGRVPRVIDCELKEDLVDSCIPGDTVTLTGIVKVHQSEEGKGKSDKSLFQLYIDVNSLINAKGAQDSATAVGIEFSDKDYSAIQKMKAEPELFKLLVSSLCPGIYGHEMVKAGLLLCIFGGCTRNESGGVPARGEPHILVVGDPGLGKSQMLQACANIAPRGVYVGGTTTTKAGLTVTLTRESGGGNALEGGALVLADQGICCIDEFDKLASQHKALLEVMEQQSISIAKAGTFCSLPARTSILAAANPIGGHYNKAKTVSENIKTSVPLLSRFDLVFILLDKPDEEADSLLSEHVMTHHSGLRDVQRSKMRDADDARVRREELLNVSVSQNSLENPLSERLKYKKGDYVDRIPHQLARKYICFSRQYVKPKLTLPAAKILRAFYLELRQKLQTSDSTPITARQLESLIRLSEARARCELREEVTERDAKDVIEIMKFSMIDTYSDEFGLLDFRRSQNGSGMSNRAQSKKFIAGLRKLSENTYKNIFSVDEMRHLARQMNIQVKDFGDFISTLNHHGFLLKKGPKIYQLLIGE